MKPLSLTLLLLLASAVLLSTFGCQATVPAGSQLNLTGAPAEISAGDIDARYTPEGLRAAFAVLSQKLGRRALRVEIDQSEFPYLVYGEFEGNCDYRDIRDVLRTMPGYTYGGSTTAVRQRGAMTSFVIHMTPRSEYAHHADGSTDHRILQRMRDLRQTQ